jgi:metallo-beta-lactamase class B
VAEIENGGAGDFQYRQHWTPVKVDRVLHDREKVTLGETTLVAHLTAGHTRGCTTWTMDVAAGGRVYHVVIVGSANVNPGYRLVNNAKYPEIAADYEKTFRVLASLPCDIFLGAHGVYYGMDEKLAKRKAGAANPFIDPSGYRAFVREREQVFQSELASQERSK